MKAPFYNWKIYLDTCCLSRPFNDQTQTRIRRETETIQTLLKFCFTEQCFWITSDVLIFEVNNTPNQIQRDYMRTQTNIEFFELGVETLLEKLGPTGVSRFLRQCEPGTGDYAVERHKWLAKIDRETGLKEIKKIQIAREAGQSDRKFETLAKTVLAGERKLPPKKVQKLTDIELYELAVEILTEKLTPAGVIGFFLQCNPVTGDCSVNRHTWLAKLKKGMILKDTYARTEKHND